MKKLLILAACLAVAASASAQGVFNGNGYGGGLKARITDGGTPLAGTVYDAQYFGGAVGTAADQLTAIGTVGHFAASGGYTGYYQAGAITTPYAIGANIVVQLRAWRDADGASWGAASTAGAGAHFGASNLVEIDNLASPTGTLPNAAGLQGFDIAPSVPEPATIALGVMGVAALLFRRRK